MVRISTRSGVATTTSESKFMRSVAAPLVTFINAVLFLAFVEYLRIGFLEMAVAVGIATLFLTAISLVIDVYARKWVLFLLDLLELFVIIFLLTSIYLGVAPTLLRSLPTLHIGLIVLAALVPIAHLLELVAARRAQSTAVEFA